MQKSRRNSKSRKRKLTTHSRYLSQLSPTGKRPFFSGQDCVFAAIKREESVNGKDQISRSLSENVKKFVK